jgi:hypothetical protein
MITQDFVEQACSEVDTYSDERMMSEFDGFFREQPALCSFIMELTSESTEQIQELSLFLSYMVFKAVKLGNSNTLAEVTPDRLEKAYRESESWIDLMNEDSARELPRDSEPHLLQYALSEINQPLEDGSELEDEQKGEVFFLVKTIISSLTRSPLGKEIK